MGVLADFEQPHQSLTTPMNELWHASSQVPPNSNNDERRRGQAVLSPSPSESSSFFSSDSGSPLDNESSSTSNRKKKKKHCKHKSHLHHKHKGKSKDVHLCRPIDPKIVNYTLRFLMMIQSEMCTIYLIFLMVQPMTSMICLTIAFLLISVKRVGRRLRTAVKVDGE
ncbi:uncharacterized protein BT62DRAFT_932909 [Guyanagaster necrorhizus]|uniref:Uncharacterized protein n=1 Tax=Guyanagaster necrorhizus TaxID=856835 RepID=A0A9P8ARZ5_9AGAR|nr:uncharacterized protein BT62DRAFT_932909 [Guyanagaster necrorhizus MCA 3950]KAG7445744.1 hypothetical protein BT62DRAFT_932909 [Guyanagaster necrorhizus MCA 3950]